MLQQRLTKLKLENLNLLEKGKKDGQEHFLICLLNPILTFPRMTILYISKAELFSKIIATLRLLDIRHVRLFLKNANQLYSNMITIKLFC